LNNYCNGNLSLHLVVTVSASNFLRLQCSYTSFPSLSHVFAAILFCQASLFILSLSNMRLCGFPYIYTQKTKNQCNIHLDILPNTLIFLSIKHRLVVLIELVHNHIEFKHTQNNIHNNYIHI